MSRIDQDVLNSASRDEAARVTFLALHGIQKEKPHAQVWAAALLFSALCHKLQLSPGEMHSKALRMLADEPFHKKANDQLEALKDFAGMRLATQPPKAKEGNLYGR